VAEVKVAETVWPTGAFRLAAIATVTSNFLKQMGHTQEQELLNLGIRAVMRKPISVQSLISQIEQTIRV